MSRWQYLRDVFANRVVIGAADGIGRIFVRCQDCSHVVPAWRLIKPHKTTERMGCKCGCMYVVPRTISTPLGLWWLFVRGYLVRGMILRKPDYDPRIPMRQVGNA